MISTRHILSMFSRLTAGLLIFILIGLEAQAQEHPLSKKDSGDVYKGLEKYEYLLENSDFRGAASALNEVAFVYWNNNHYRQAADYYEKSYELNVKVANENGLAMINNNLGMLYADLGEYDKAFEKFNQTLAARRANDEVDGMISALINLSVVLNRLERYNESISNLTEALTLAREGYDKEMMRSIYGMLSETYGFQGDVEKSLQNFELYKSFHEEIQREKVSDVQKELEKERIQKQEAQLENQKRENELLRKENELLRNQKLLEEKDSVNTGLYSDLSRKQVEIALLNKDKELQEAQLQIRNKENEDLSRQRTYIIVFSLIIFILISIVLFIVYRFGKRSKKQAMELAATNKTLDENRKELEIANKTKEKIFSIIAHDLRGPMVSLSSLFHLLSDDEVSPDMQEAMASMRAELSNSVTILDNLLEWSRTEIKGEILKTEKINIAEKIEHTFKLLEPHASRKEVVLQSNVNSEDHIHTNTEVLSIVLRNLIQNAIKFTAKGGSVTVNNQTQSGRQIISVTDTGIGMDDDLIKRIFDISQRTNRLGTAQEKGSGLGLVLCKELIQKAGGLLSVESKVNQGTTFSITI